MNMEEYKNLKIGNDVYFIVKYSIVKDIVMFKEHTWIGGKQTNGDTNMEQASLTFEGAKDILKKKIQFDIDKNIAETCLLEYRTSELQKILDKVNKGEISYE